MLVLPAISTTGLNALEKNNVSEIRPIARMVEFDRLNLNKVPEDPNATTDFDFLEEISDVTIQNREFDYAITFRPTGEASAGGSNDIAFVLKAAQEGAKNTESLQVQVARVTGQARGYREYETIAQN